MQQQTACEAPEEPSHTPSAWTLRAEIALADAMDSLGVKSFTISRPHSAQKNFANCSNQNQFRYMAGTISSSDVGMSGTVNGHAVVKKITSLQLKWSSDEDGFKMWRQELNQRQSAAEAQSDDVCQGLVRKDTVEDKFKKIFSAGDVKAIAENSEYILESIQLLRTSGDLAHKLLQLLAASREGPDTTSRNISNLLQATTRLSSVGEEGLLPRLLSVLAQHCEDIENFPVMIQDMYDFANVISGKNPGGMRYTKAKKDECALLLRTAGKQAIHNARGFGWSQVNLDDDAGRASRRQKRKGLLTDEDVDDEGEGSNTADGQETRKIPRFNRVMPCVRTLQRHVKNVKDIMRGPGIHEKELESFTNEVVNAGQDAGIIAYAFDKVQHAQQHPGDGCTGDGETDCGGLLPGAGMDLADRLAWKNDMRAKITLSVTDMKSTPKVLEWHGRIQEAHMIIQPKLHCPDGEYTFIVRNDSEGGHTRMCTRHSLWSACAHEAAAVGKGNLLFTIPAEYATR